MSSVSTIGQSTFLNTQILGIESSLDKLSDQISSGKKSTDFAGISTVSQLSLQLTNAQTTTQGYLTNISNAGTIIAPVQSILQQVTDIANQLRNDALNASSDTLPVTQGNGALQAEAQDALNQISALLNTKVGNDFLFGGRVTSAPPMPNFGSVTNASSIVGQVAGLNSSIPLNANTSSGDQLYEAIQSFLRNGITYTASTGASAPSAFGYSGETAEPGGSAFRFTTSGTTAQDSTTVTLSQTADLPIPGQYIEFGTVPPQNAAYLVTSVSGQTVTFQRVPAGTGGPPTNGVDNAIPAGTSVNVVSPSAVTTVNSPPALSPFATLPSATVAAGSTSFTVTDPSNYFSGEIIQFSNDPANQYQVTGVAGNTVSIGQMVNGAVTGGGLVTAIPAGSTPNVFLLSGTDTVGNALAGATSIQVSTPSLYHVGDRVSFAPGGLNGPYYDVTFIDQAASTINFVPAGQTSGGLASGVAFGATVNIIPGTPPGSTFVSVPSTTNVTAGMSVKFSNSSSVYTVKRIVSPTQIEITLAGTAAGVGLTDPLPPPIPLQLQGTPTTAPGTDVTASFGAAIPTQSVQVDNGVSVQYGIRANDPAFQKVLGAIFALATTTLNSTTQAGFRQVAARAAADLQAGSAQITQVAATLGVKQQTLDATQQRLNDFNTTLQSQLSNLNDVDMAAAVSKLTETQTQLQASFQLLSTMKNLTLANYL